jgi:hypothetical protein
MINRIREMKARQVEGGIIITRIKRIYSIAIMMMNRVQIKDIDNSPN